MSLKILEIYNFLLAHGEREIIENVETLEEAREIVKFKLIYEGDHAQYNFDQKILSIKNFLLIILIMAIEN